MLKVAILFVLFSNAVYSDPVAESRYGLHPGSCDVDCNSSYHATGLVYRCTNGFDCGDVENACQFWRVRGTIAVICESSALPPRPPTRTAYVPHGYCKMKYDNSGVARILEENCQDDYYCPIPTTKKKKLAGDEELLTCVSESRRRTMRRPGF